MINWILDNLLEASAIFFTVFFFIPWLYGVLKRGYADDVYIDDR